MPKPVTTSMLALLQTRNGTEPIFVVGVNFGAGVVWFSSKKIIDDTIFPGSRAALISVSECSNEKRHDSAGTTGTVTVTLSDFDGYAKFVHDNTQLQKAPAKLYVWFEDQPSEAAICLLAGQISGEGNWDEAERTLTFTIDAAIEGQEVGFAPTDEFTDLAPEAVDVPWPMIFGKPAMVPAPRVRHKISGRLLLPIRLKSRIVKADPSDQTILMLDEDCKVITYAAGAIEENKIYIEGGEQFPQGQLIEIEIEKCVFRGTMAGTVMTVTEANVPYYTNIPIEPDAGTGAEVLGATVAKKSFGAKIKGDDFKGDLTGMHIYLAPANKGDKFYNFVQKQENRRLRWKYSFSQITVAGLVSTRTFKEMDGARTIERAYYVLPNGVSNEYADRNEIILNISRYVLAKADLKGTPFGTGREVLNGISQLYADHADATDDVMWHQSGGVPVTIRSNEPDIYIASCVPLDSVEAVYGRRTIRNGKGPDVKVYDVIPASMYEVQEQSSYKVNDADYATGILFPRPLKEFKEMGWDDEIFVTGTSSIGPNVADIIQYLLETYAPDIVIGDFDDARTLTAPDPAHFAILERRNVFDLCREIAWQARCALRLDGPKADLIFLDQTHSATLTLDQSGIVEDSISVGTTDINSIVTKLIGRWRPDLRGLTNLDAAYDRKSNEINRIVRNLVDRNHLGTEKVYVYRENIAKYGERVEEKRIYIYNNEESVAKTIDYWGHIMANSWRTVRLTGSLLGCFVQAFDWFELNVSGWGMAGYNGLRGEIESVSVDPAAKTVSYSLRLEVVAGE